MSADPIPTTEHLAGLGDFQMQNLLFAASGSVRLSILGVILLGLMTGAFFLGRRLRIRCERKARRTKSKLDGYIVTAVLGLLALLLGFTFSLAVSRFEERRSIVATQANAISTAYLRVQLLGPPYREHISHLIRDYTAIQLRLAAIGYPSSGPLRAEADGLLTKIWAATVAALKAPEGVPFATLVGSSVTGLIDEDGFRQSARDARVPITILIVLWIFLVSVGGVLGYETRKGETVLAACFVLALMTASLLLVMDIDRPSSGAIVESQTPMEQLSHSLMRSPPAVFGR